MPEYTKNCGQICSFTSHILKSLKYILVTFSLYLLTIWVIYAIWGYVGQSGGLWSIYIGRPIT
jgi:hypothetical protein